MFEKTLNLRVKHWASGGALGPHQNHQSLGDHRLVPFADSSAPVHSSPLRPVPALAKSCALFHHLHSPLCRKEAQIFRGARLAVGQTQPNRHVWPRWQR
jgi:hypothetical protein